MIQVADGVVFIQGQDEMLPDAHVYLIGRAGSGDLSLIDAGLMGKGGGKMDEIRAAGVPLQEIRRVIMSHIHLDHIGCLEEIRALLPWTELWVHGIEADALENGDDRFVYGSAMFKTTLKPMFNLRDGAFTFPVDRRLEDGEKLAIGGMTWEVLHIPGHSAGSIALYDAAGRVLIPGDTVYADGAIGRFDLHGADPKALDASLVRLAELEVDILLPGHNDILESVPDGYIADTARQWAADPK